MPESGVPNYPLLFRHMVVAIYKSGDVKASSSKKKFEESIQIALSQLKKYGYIREDSTESQVLLTGKGVTKNNSHLRETDKGPKTRLFDSLYKQLKAEDKDRASKPGGIPSSLRVDGKPIKNLS